MIRLAITETSVKMRSGGAARDEDVFLPVCAGVLPLRTVADPTETGPRHRR